MAETFNNVQVAVRVRPPDPRDGGGSRVGNSPNSSTGSDLASSRLHSLSRQMVVAEGKEDSVVVVGTFFTHPS